MISHARVLVPFCLCLCLSLSLFLGGCKGKEKPAWCSKLAPVPTSGKAFEQAATLGRALAAFGVPETDVAFGGLQRELKNIETGLQKPLSAASADQLATDVGIAAAAWRKVANYDCEKSEPHWEAEIKKLQESIKKDAVELEKNQKASLDKQDAQKDAADADRITKVNTCKDAAVAQLGKKIALSADHYSRSSGSRGGIAFYRKKGAAWEGDPPSFSAVDPGSVATQADLVLSRDSAKCIELGDTVKGRTVKVQVCGRQVDVVTCDLKTGNLIGAAQFVLPPPEELKVRGTIRESADRHLAAQLLSRLGSLSWR